LIHWENQLHLKNIEVDISLVEHIPFSIFNQLKLVEIMTNLNSPEKYTRDFVVSYVITVTGEVEASYVILP